MRIRMRRGTVETGDGTFFPSQPHDFAYFTALARRVGVRDRVAARDRPDVLPRAAEAGGGRDAVTARGSVAFPVSSRGSRPLAHRTSGAADLPTGTPRPL
jgi:hypothetical protein